jgi:RNA polymerase sigma-70 factor (ECF subfamily)
MNGTSSGARALRTTEATDDVGGAPVRPFDPARLESMFKAHHTLVWRTFRRLGFDEDGATDGTQQVFLVAAERLSDIRESSERAFLFSTTLRMAKTLSRKKRRMELADDMDVHPDPSRTEQRAADHQSALELMDRVLSRMDRDLVMVFVLYEVEGLSTPELAALLEIPLGTAASRLRRAREAFRELAADAQKVFTENRV